MAVTPQVSRSLSRLVKVDFAHQIEVLFRTRQDSPGRIIEWFEFWLNQRQQFHDQIAVLNPAVASMIGQLAALYRATYDVDPLPKPKPQTHTSVNEVFETLADPTLMVGTGHANSLLVCGPGAIGKTFTVREALQSQTLSFASLRGYISPVAFYNFLYEHRTELIVVDDCDVIFDDRNGLNILKAVLETTEPREVAWHSPSMMVSIGRFQFTGRIVFVTNLPLIKVNEHMHALLTRVHVFHMDLSSDEVIQRMRFIAAHAEYKSSTREQRLSVITFLEEQKKAIPNLNLRHYIKALDLKLYAPRRWQRLFLATI